MPCRRGEAVVALFFTLTLATSPQIDAEQVSAIKIRFGNRQEAVEASAAFKGQLQVADNAQLLQRFAEWKLEFNKTYKSAEQEASRFGIWKRSLETVVENNLLSEDDGSELFSALNDFSDQTFEEVQSSWLMPSGDPEELERRNDDAPRIGLHFEGTVASVGGRKLKGRAGWPGYSRQPFKQPPLQFDWREQGKVPPRVRLQGACGSCWAFAAMAALECRAMRRGAVGADFSEQQALDCITPKDGYCSMGCAGGYSDEVFRWAASQYVVVESEYWYTGHQGRCKTPPRKVSQAPYGTVKLYDYPGYFVVEPDPQAIMSAVYNYGPVVVYFNANDAFISYGGGIFQAKYCANNIYNHAMIIVGYDARAGIGSPKSYWILRNSAGPTWGEGGYARVQMTKDHYGACRMYSGRMVVFSQ